MAACWCYVLVASLLLLVSHFHVCAQQKKLLLILVDGVRWDYPDESVNYTGFKRLEVNGVRALYTNPIFPTNSYPNWYTIVTGLYAESHGFVNNMMYDSNYNDFFLMAPNETASVAHWWNSAEPLWITAEKRGLRSALYWWDGCQVEIRGRKPSHCTPYKYIGNSWSSVNNDTAKVLKTALELFENDEIQLVQVYYEPIDFFGHKFGPESEERKRATMDFDRLLADLQTGLSKRKLDDQVNLVVLSDHGMKSTDIRRSLNVINLPQFIDVDDIKYMIYYGASCMILPHEGKLEKIYKALKTIKGLNVYKKEDIPERYHLKNNRLTQPLLLVSNRDYYIKGLDIPGKSIPTGSAISLGSHGYDILDVQEMRGIFYARGPSFKKGYQSNALEMVDIYNVLCDALSIESLPNNGSRTRTNSMLIENDSPRITSTFAITLTSSVIMCFASALRSNL